MPIVNRGLSVRWKKHDDYAIVSDDGRYSICRIGEAFEVWRTRQHDEGPHLVATNLPDSQEARKLAEADSEDA